MKSIIFLDLDGPMIPWWGATVPFMDERKGKILDNFNFLSQFHPEAIASLRRLVAETGAHVVTNTTHNKMGLTHINRLFDANGVRDLLYPDGAYPWPRYMTGFKNADLKDWRGRKDRALGIKAWFTRFGISMAATPFVAIDDNIGDFQKYNTTFPHYPKIPYVQTGLGSVEYFNVDDMDIAIQTIRTHPNYVGKI